MNKESNLSRPAEFEDRFRLYLDESGDHVFRDTTQISHRFLCLLGCWFKNPDYLQFHESLEKLKEYYFHHHPDNPVILHREDIINKRKAFKILQDENKRAEFDNDLFNLIQKAEFKVVAIVIDKDVLRASYGETAAHPYHLGLGFLLQRFTGYLNRINRIGDVMAEARGGKEDLLLKESYTRIYQHGNWGVSSSTAFQLALSSSQLKLREKKTNISGLQLADLLGHPAKMWALRYYKIANDEPPPFAKRLMKIVEEKFNRQFFNNKLEGYGIVLYPKK
jgi:curved DNA-binding protein CbpA